MNEVGEVPENLQMLSKNENTSGDNILLETADRLILKPTPLITDKVNSPSEDNRDFVSISTYHHLDKDGNAVYIDTVINPDIENYQDPNKLKQIKNAIYLTSLAANATEDTAQKDRYKNYAVNAIKTWFIDEETRMNPNLEYAHIKPGENGGNFWGIIDGVGLAQIVEGINNFKEAGLLDENNEADKKILEGANKWFDEYLTWLLTSEKGIGNKDAENERERIGEKGMPNNHGTFYDVQVAYIADFLGKDEVVREAIESTKKRIKVQITPDGEMSAETARGDMSLDYQVFNLFALSKMAIIARKYDEDLWNFEIEGKSIKKAFEYVNTQLKGKSKDSFRYDRKSELYFSYRAASQAYRNEEYWELPENIYNDPLSSEVSAKMFMGK